MSGAETTFCETQNPERRPDHQDSVRHGEGISPAESEVPMSESVSLDLLQSMVQRVLDGQAMLREDNRNLRRRLSRIEHALLALQRAELGRSEGEGGTQDQIDALAERLERVEAKTAGH